MPKPRHDNAVGVRQQHVAVGLRQGQAHRQAGVLLPARQRLDGGAYLLADASGGKQPQAQHGGDKELNVWVQLRFKPHADIFLKELLRNGTTTALVFGSVHPQSVDALSLRSSHRP